MQRSWLGLSGAILLLLGTALLDGCKQKQGERCQLNSDCSDTFICCLKSSPTALTGVCTLPETCVSVPDAAVPDKAPADQKLEPRPDRGGGADKLAADRATPDKTPLDRAPPAPDAKTEK